MIAYLGIEIDVSVRQCFCRCRRILASDLRKQHLSRKADKRFTTNMRGRSLE